VLIVDRGELKVALSADEADQQKVILWASEFQNVETRVRKHLREGDLSENVLRVRKHGQSARRRVEVILDSKQAREDVFQELKQEAGRIGVAKSCVVRGRTYEERIQGRKGRRHTQALPPKGLPRVCSQNIFWPLLEKSVEEAAWMPGDTIHRKWPIRLAAFNANGLREADAMEIGRIAEFELDLIGITETYFQHEHRAPFFPKCTWYGRNLIPGTARSKKIEGTSHGVGFVVNRKITQVVEVIQPQPKFHDSMWVRVQGSVQRKLPIQRKDGRRSAETVSAPKDLWVGLYYLSPNLPAGGVKEAVDEMENFIRKAKAAGGEVVVMGDLNCNLKASKLANAHARTLTKMLGATGLVPLSKKDRGVKCTRHLHGEPISEIDYILVDQGTAPEWGQQRVRSDLALDSDHWMITAKHRNWFHTSRPKPEPTVVQAAGAVWKPRAGYNVTKLRRVVQPSLELRNAHSPEHDNDKRLLSPEHDNDKRLPSPEHDNDKRLLSPEQDNDKRLPQRNVQGTGDERRAASPAQDHKSKTDAATPNRRTVADVLGEQTQRALNDWRVDSYRSVAEAYQGWLAKVTTSADRVLGKPQPPKKRKRAMPDYVDEEMWSCIQTRRKQWTKLRSAINRGEPNQVRDSLWEEYRSAMEACQVKARAKQAEGWERWIQELSVKWETDPKKFWRSISCLRKKGTKGFGAMEDGEGGLVYPGQPEYIKRWKDYYEKLGNEESQRPVTEEIRRFHQTIQERAADGKLLDDPPPSRKHDQLNETITPEEVLEMIKKLPAGKAAGPDGISYEIIKVTGETGARTLCTLFNRAFDEGMVAEEFQQAVCCPLPKVEGTRKMTESRGISLLSCIGKLYAKLLNTRIARFLETEGVLIPEQGGFRKLWAPARGRSTVEQSLTLAETLRRRKAQGMETYLTFIDLRKAYDRVWREGLWVKLAELGIQGKMLRALHQLYGKVQVAVRCNGQVSELFDVAIGLKQGCVLSPILFTVFINDILADCKAQGLGVQVLGSTLRASPWVKGKLAGLLWADDLVLIAETPGDMSKMLDCITRWLDKWKMEANADKCAVMVCGRTGEEKEATEKLQQETSRGNHKFCIQGGVVNIVTQYKYLGTYFASNLEWTMEREARVKATARAVDSLRLVLRQYSLKASTRCRLLQAIVYPIALYGAGLWYEGGSTAKKLEAAVSVGQRLILGAGNRTSRAACEMELGLVPIRYLALASRVNLLLRVLGRKAEPRPMTSTYWLRCLTSGPPPRTKGWGWFRLSAYMARGILPKENHKMLTSKAMFGSILSLEKLEAVEGQIRTGLVSRTQKDHATKAKSSWVIRQLLANKSETYEIERYLDVGDQLGRRIIFRMRTNTLYLNSISCRWIKYLPSHCLACGDTKSKEDTPHFLWKCPALRAPRRNMFPERSLPTSPSSLSLLLSLFPPASLPSSPLSSPLSPLFSSSLKLALSPPSPLQPSISSFSADVFGPLHEEQPAPSTVSQEDGLDRCLETQAKGLAEMWKLRCELQNAALSVRKRLDQKPSHKSSEPKPLGKADNELCG
jgi:hypothetical protein